MACAGYLMHDQLKMEKMGRHVLMFEANLAGNVGI